MKDILKRYSKAIVVIILIILFAWGMFAAINWGLVMRDQNTALINSRDSLYLQAQYYKDKNGELVAQVKTFELTTSDLKKVGDELGFDKKRLESQVGNLKNLVGYWKGQASAHGGDTVLLRDTIYVTLRGDTIKAQKLNWTDTHLTLTGLYRPTDSKFSFDYSYDLGGFEITAYRKRQGLFKPKQLVSDVRFGDENLKVTQFQGVVIKEEKKKFWETKGFAFGAGLVGGAILMRK